MNTVVIYGVLSHNLGLHVLPPAGLHFFFVAIGEAMKLQSTLSSPVLPHSNGFRVTINGQSKPKHNRVNWERGQKLLSKLQFWIQNSMVVRWCYLLPIWLSMPGQPTHRGLQLPGSQIRFQRCTEETGEKGKKTFSRQLVSISESVHLKACWTDEQKSINHNVLRYTFDISCLCDFFFSIDIEIMPALAYIQRPTYSRVGWCLPSLLCYLCQQGPWDDFPMLDDSDDKKFFLQMLYSCLLTQIADIFIPCTTLLIY